MSRILLPVLSALMMVAACTKQPHAISQGVWSDDVTAIDLILAGPYDDCDEVITFTYPMSGRRLSPKRIELFKSLGAFREHDLSRCLESGTFGRESFIVNPGTANAAHYASARDACLYYKNFEGQLRILAVDDFARIMAEITPKRLGMDSYTRNETDAFYSRTFDENGPFGLTLEGADPATFKALADNYASDGLSVWNESRRIEGADPATFMIKGEGWSQDAQHVYFSEHALPNADVQSFQILDSAYGKDNKSVYLMNNLIEGVDPATFQVHALGPYSRDQKHVIYRDRIVPGADVLTFEAKHFYDFATDAQAVYFETTRLDLDRANFVKVGGSYAKDNSKVYYLDRLIEGADPATFEAGSCEEGPVGLPPQSPNNWPKLRCKKGNSPMYCFSRDKNSVYRNGVRVGPR